MSDAVIIGSDSPLPVVFNTDNGFKLGLAKQYKSDSSVSIVFRVGNSFFQADNRKLQFLIPEEVRPKGLELTQVGEWIPRTSTSDRDLYSR